MAEADVTRALHDKKGELTAGINQLERQIVEHRAGLAHLEGVMRLFDPSIQPETEGAGQRTAQKTWFRPGESLRLIYDVRREAYDLLASPTLNPGQTVQAHVKATTSKDVPVEGALTINVYDSNGAIEPLTGSSVAVSVEGSTLVWTIPDLGGRSIADVGIALLGSGDETVLLDWLDWDGTPTVRLGREADGGGEFWRRAWVDAVTTWAENPYGHAFRLSQEQGHGLLIYGTRDWRDYRVSSRLAINLGSGGLAARVQGLRRYYALELAPGGTVQLILAYDDKRTVLAQAVFDWQLDDWVDLALVVQGTSLRGSVNGQQLLEAENSQLSSGAIALACSEGTLSTEEVRVSGITGD